MSDNGSAFFNASKPNRNASFNVANEGDASGDTDASYQGTPFGTDKNNRSHIQTPRPVARGGLPGEQEDPRLC